MVSKARGWCIIETTNKDRMVIEMLISDVAVRTLIVRRLIFAFSLFKYIERPYFSCVFDWNCSCPSLVSRTLK